MSAYNSVNGEWCGREPRAAHRRPPRRVGLRGLRDQRLDLRPARRGEVGDRPASTSRCPTGWCGPAPAAARSSGARPRGTTSTARSSGSSPRCCASTTSLSAPDAARDVLGSPGTSGARREVGRAARSCLLRNEPVDGRPVLPARSVGVRGRGLGRARRRPSTSATAGRATCGTGGRDDPRRLRAPLLGRDVVHDDGSDRPRPRRSRPATPTSPCGRRLHVPRRGRVHRRGRHRPSAGPLPGGRRPRGRRAVQR